jgi:hypothetical protein
VTDDELIDAYTDDPGLPYGLEISDLRRLLALVGEDEPIIDAILVLGDASVEERAEAIGCSPDDFYY